MLESSRCIHPVPLRDAVAAAAVTDTLYYEKLEMSILELENKLARQVVWMNAHRQEEVRCRRD